MTCYLVRHGKDDDSIRGGWSDNGLTPAGVEQVNTLTKEIAATNRDISCIYSSDLQRAKETAMIFAGELRLPIVYTPEFREVNNGDLAGMKNELADQRYPGVYWSSLAYAECYPNGESPEMFYNRIKTAWKEFKNRISQQTSDVLLVTHGGVMEVILCIENNIVYTNKKKHFSTPNAKLISVEIK